MGIQAFSYINEKIGRTYFKILAVRCTGTGMMDFERKMYVADNNPVEALQDYVLGSVGSTYVFTTDLGVPLMPVLLTDVGVPKGFHIEVISMKIPIKKYALVSSHYFSADEKEWIYDEMHTFPIYLEYEALGQREGHVQIVDFDTGEHLFFGGSWYPDPLCTPEKISAVQDVRDWKAYVAGKIGGNSIMMFILGALLAGIIVYFVMANASAISHLFTHASTNSTKTTQFILSLIGGEYNRG